MKASLKVCLVVFCLLGPLGGVYADVGWPQERLDNRLRHLGGRGFDNPELFVDEDIDNLEIQVEIAEVNEIPEGQWTQLLEHIDTVMAEFEDDDNSFENVQPAELEEEASQDAGDEYNDAVMPLIRQLADEHGFAIMYQDSPELHLKYSNLLFELADFYADSDDADHQVKALEFYLTAAFYGLKHTNGDDDEHIANASSGLEGAKSLRLGNEIDFDPDLTRGQLINILLEEVDLQAKGTATEDPLVMTPIERVPFLQVGAHTWIFQLKEAEVQENQDLKASCAVKARSYMAEANRLREFHNELVGAIQGVLGANEDAS